MPSRRQQRRSLAIAWMRMMIVAASLAGVPGANDDIASLFAAKPGHDHVSNRRTNVPSDKRSLQSSLSDLPGPDIFKDAESFADTQSNAPHPRFKRIADPMDSPPRRSRRLPPPHLTARRRSSRRMFRRFALEESNPADEGEAEYVYDDDVDVPGAFLNDEITKKRNQFEDVYPEVSKLPKSQQSPPDFLKRPVEVDDVVRKKRDRDEAEEEEEEEAADCAEGAHEEYYYEDEAPEVSRRGNNKRASQSGVEYIDGERRMDKRKSDVISAVNSNHRNVDKNSKVNEEDYLHVSNKEDRAAPLTANIQEPLTSRKIVRSSARERSQMKASNVAKMSAAKGSSSLVKRKSQKRPMKEKQRPKPKAKPKPKPRPKPQKPKPRKKQKPKSIAGAQTAKLSSDCCEEKVEEAPSDVDRYRRDKTLVIKAVPKGKNTNELQIFEKADDVKKKAVSKVAPKQSSAKDLTALSIGEVKDLLGKLMVKIDNLHDLISELRNGGGDAQIEGANEEPTRLSSSPSDSHRRASCRRRWGPWARWGGCSVTCGRGAQSRSRSCLAGCSHHLSLESEERVCSNPECPAATKFLGIF